MHTTILVTIKGPRCNIDLEVPAEIPISDLIPPLLEICGPQPLHPALKNSNIWGLGLVDSSNPLAGNRSLIDTDVMDGAVLVLQTMESWANQHLLPITKPPEPGRPGYIWNKGGLLYKS
jgi:hypothetical protein